QKAKPKNVANANEYLQSVLLRIGFDNTKSIGLYSRYRPALRQSCRTDSSYEQNQSCHDHEGSDDLRDALTGRCETFGSNARRHDSHRPKVHDPDDQENRYQTGTALTAVEAEAQA